MDKTKLMTEIPEKKQKKSLVVWLSRDSFLTFGNFNAHNGFNASDLIFRTDNLDWGQKDKENTKSCTKVRITIEEI